MNSRRKQTQDFILSAIKAVTQSAFNVQRYQTFFDKLSDKEFDAWMKDLKSEEKFLTIMAANFSDTKLSVENNLNVAKKLNVKFFQQLYIGAQGDVPGYLTPVEYLVVDLPLRRASQMLIKKISVADHSRSVDILTGQVAGDSKTSKISYPELQIAAAMDLEDSLIELIKYRGGDRRGGAAMDAMIKKYGRASLKTLEPYASGVESTKSLKTFLTSAHLRSTL
jgi:hypothetical protein